MYPDYWHDRVSSAKDTDFASLAIELYDYQRQNNPVYSKYLDALARNKPVDSILDISFLPISFFKTHSVKTGDWIPETAFHSSGTTNTGTSRHEVRALEWYFHNARYCFENSFGPMSQYQFAGLLPSYLDRPNSSLVAMVQYFSEMSNPNGANHFFSHDLAALMDFLKTHQRQHTRLVLFALSVAAYDLALLYELVYPELTIIETGGVKTDRRTLLKEEIVSQLRQSFPASTIASEYGMTELMSQCYAKNAEHYRPHARMAFLISEINDPFCWVGAGVRGQINVIDLANADSCCFIQTEDCGLLDEQNCLKILGRLDHAELRGCSAMWDGN